MKLNLTQGTYEESQKNLKYEKSRIKSEWFDTLDSFSIAQKEQNQITNKTFTKKVKSPIQKFQALTQADTERKVLNLGGIIEQSKDFLSKIEQKQDENKESSKSHDEEEIVALDKNYKEKSHNFAEKFLEQHKKKYDD